MSGDYTIFSISPAYTRQDTKELASNINGKLIEGQYKGVKELSILIPSEEFKDTLRTKVVAFADQESVLHLKRTNVKGHYLAYLEYFREDEVKYVGMLSESTKEEALKRDSYSFDPEQNKYFTINEA